MIWKLFRCLLLVLAVVTAGGEAWAGLSKTTDRGLCDGASPMANSNNSLEYQSEIKRRGIDCRKYGYFYIGTWDIEDTDLAVCINTNYLLYLGNDEVRPEKYVKEIKRRGISCENIVGASTYVGSLESAERVCSIVNRAGPHYKAYPYMDKFRPRFILEAQRRNLNCAGISKQNSIAESKAFYNWTDSSLCGTAILNGRWEIRSQYLEHVKEAKRRGLSCGVGESSKTQIASTTTNESKKPTSAELEAERQKRIQLEQQLAALKAQQEQRQQTISSDTQKPIIKITNTSSNGPRGTVRGRVTDNTGIAEVRVDGQLVQVDDSGNFTQNTFVPVGGTAITVQATDLAGLSSSMSVRLERTATASSPTLSFARLNPLVRKVAKNKDALALVIGVDSYENTSARAIYADKDAQVFADYATEKLGIPANRIKTLVNNGAGERELLLSVKSWLSRASKQGKTDVYVFFAGHGLASDDGEKMYLLPYDGAPELLDDTAILRDRLFSDIASANPRSVTVFLDTCYSGTTRGTDMLIASRPIAIKAIQKSIPKGFTVMTAAAGDQTAKPLEEAKHGMFSYFLMKGMEGDADANNDNQITAGELHSYVQQNVVQQSSGSQTPELQGDADRVLVRFQ